jgi:hypothetical protein
MRCASEPQTFSFRPGCLECLFVIVCLLFAFCLLAADGLIRKNCRAQPHKGEASMHAIQDPTATTHATASTFLASHGGVRPEGDTQHHRQGGTYKRQHDAVMVCRRRHTRDRKIDVQSESTGACEQFEAPGPGRGSLTSSAASLPSSTALSSSSSSPILPSEMQTRRDLEALARFHFTSDAPQLFPRPLLPSCYRKPALSILRLLSLSQKRAQIPPCGG